MEQPKVTAVVFEGGQAKTSLEEVIKDVRKQVVVDTLSKLVMAPEIDQVLLVTNYEDLDVYKRQSKGRPNVFHHRL